MLHELAISYFAMGNVFANGMGADITMELMYGAVYSNLFTNINVGAGTAPFGWVVRGQDAAAYNTFWNIRRWGGLTLPPWTWAPRANFINMNDAAQVCGGPALLLMNGCGRILCVAVGVSTAPFGLVGRDQGAAATTIAEIPGAW